MCILGAGDATESAAAVEVRRLWPEIRVAVGVHPHHASRFRVARPTRRRSSAPAITAEGASAIGEIGLDYHYDFSPKDTQQAVFNVQVSLARKLDLPIVIHTREARTTLSAS